MTSLLLAEDDLDIAEPLSRALTRDGFGVDVCRNGHAALDRVAEGNIDLLILDLGLPGMDGVDVCRRLREEGSEVPILMLTARAEEIDTVIGLDAGADDYVTKPFRLEELRARIRALLRRGSVSMVYEVQDIRVDVEARRAFRSDVELSLSAKEFDLLRVLIREAGQVVTRERLLNEVWDAEVLSSSKTIDMHVSWLRRKLEDDPNEPRYISTVRGVGFRFERV